MVDKFTKPVSDKAINDKINEIIDAIDEKANDSDVVHLTGSEYIEGVKTVNSLEANNPVLNNALIRGATMQDTITAPTPDTSDNSTKVATTAFVKNQGYIKSAGNGTITITQGGVTKGSFTVNQTGNTIIDVDAVSTDEDTTKFVVNNYRDDTALAIGKDSSTGNYGIAIGREATTQVAYNDTNYNLYGIAIGNEARAIGTNGIAIGNEARANRINSIQIGWGTNNDDKTLKIGFNSEFVTGKNYTLLDYNGYIPNARLNNDVCRADNMDTSLDSKSWRPVQNKVITEAINNKQDTITGGASTITSSNLTANRALVSDSNGKVAVNSAGVTDAELGAIKNITVNAVNLNQLAGCTSNVQTQLNNKANASDVQTQLNNKANASDVYTKTEADAKYITSHQDISGKENTSNKVTSLSSSSTNTQYPSAKCVYNGLAGKQNKVTITYDV